MQRALPAPLTLAGRPSPGRLGSRTAAWLAGAGIWTLLAVMSASQVVADRLYEGRTTEWERVFTRTLADWYTCAVFTPAIFWLVRRIPPSTSRLGRTLLVYPAAAASFILLKSTLFAGVARVLSPGGAPPWSRMVAGNVFALTLTFAGITVIVVALEHQRRAREKELRASRLEARLAEVQVQALRAQLNPHFLFNALNALSALIHSDPAAADRMVVRLGELLRGALDAGDAPEVPLRDEIRLVERYLDVMKVRLGERLQVTVDIAAGVLDAHVPNLLLQPLVENAVLHGIGGHPDAGRLRIAARREGEWLVLEVQDDGPGIAPDAAERVGLGNTRLRLRQLYDERHRISLECPEGGGTRVVIAIPYRMEGA
jgi:signal transduction histidine kinase